MVGERCAHVQHIAARPPAVLRRPDKAKGGGLRAVGRHRLAQQLRRPGRDVGRLVLATDPLLHRPAGNQLVSRPVENQDFVVVVRGFEHHTAAATAVRFRVGVAATAGPT